MIRIAAPAKLNLFLHVTGKRPDGYHLLESLTVFTEFGDIVEAAPAEILTLKITGPQASSLENAPDNLVLRAAQLLQPSLSHGAALTLHKHIPVGAGLGGGSADAAATITALEKLWNLTLPPAARHAIALQLGSDVPACALATPGWLTGTGDTVTPITIPSAWVVLVNPNIPLLTADVFRANREAFHPSITKPHPTSAFALAAWAATQSNTLEKPAITLQPAIAEILRAITATQECLLARMSGSGATCFGFYDNEPAATAAAKHLATAHPDWWVKATAMKGTAHGQAQ